MEKKKTRLELVQEEVTAKIQETNRKIEELGGNTERLYQQLTTIQSLFNAIRNVPGDKRAKYESLVEIQLNWKQQADKIEKDFKAAVVKNVGKGAVAVAGGAAIAALGPTAAMGVATTFGVASTGTPIAALGGAAATNAALAWLGGGALAAGGGGMAAGSAFLACAGPLGWAIAGVALCTGGFFLWKAKEHKERLENVFALVGKRDSKSYDLAIVELNERIKRIKNESDLIEQAIRKIRGFGNDYGKMTEAQQYELGAYVNLMEASTQLLTNPIAGLLPKYTDEDFDKFAGSHRGRKSAGYCSRYRELLISLSNLFYNIKLDEQDRSLLTKSFQSNEDFLSAMKINKKDFDIQIMNLVCECLEYQYSSKRIGSILKKKPEMQFRR